jgi:hypothetical protein
MIPPPSHAEATRRYRAAPPSVPCIGGRFGVRPATALPPGWPAASRRHAPVAAATSSYPLAHADRGGWTLQWLQALNDASGLGPRCGMAGADTATRGWAEEHLVAAHTRCVVGLGPPPAGHDRAA